MKRYSRGERRQMLGALAACCISSSLYVVAGLAAAQPQPPLKIGAVASLTCPASCFAKDWAAGFDAYV